MSKRTTAHLCAWCRDPLAVHGCLIVCVEGPSGEKIRIGWHSEGRTCADEDPLHAALADSFRLPDGADGDAATRIAYLAIRDRASGYGVATLRGVIDVRADFARGSQTLRGPGLLWGRMAERLRGPQRPANGRTLRRVATPTQEGPHGAAGEV